MEMRCQLVFVSQVVFSTLMDNCVFFFFFSGRSLEIELSLFVTPRDNPCHATVPMAMSWLRVQHRKLQLGEERVQLHLG